MDTIKVLLVVGCMVASARACQDRDTKMDDCNNCICLNGNWACTMMLCPPTECQNGETKKEDCNTCTCSNGVWACTEMFCLGKKSECQDGDTKMQDCNTCNCYGGEWACTRMLCETVPITECQDGDTKMEDCNTCTCGNGVWACTAMFCLGKKSECQDGDTKMQDCNTCSCYGGEWACTLMLCETVPVTECQNGETKMEDCNTCTCSNEVWACTAMFCLGKKSECQDGDTKMEECNTCTCYGGIWACTLMMCHAPPECQEGDTKMEDCNTCTCSNGVWACTMMFCPPAAECQGGDTKMEDCNICTCDVSIDHHGGTFGGTWACTLMMCLGKRSEETSEVCIEAAGTHQCFPAKREESCTLGDTKKLDCNDCTCVGNGDTTFWMCTMRGCISKKEIAVDTESSCISAAGTVQCFPSKRQDPECEAGETKKEDCNTCICAGGHWACTMMFCLGSEKIRSLERRKNCIVVGNVRQCFDKREKGALEKCTSGRAFKIDCNLCMCQGGEWLCTLKTCQSNLRSLTERSEIEAKGVCTDEEVKMKGCNTCICIGGEWMCTMRMCRAIQRVKRSSEVETAIQDKRASTSIQDKRALPCQDEEAKRKHCNICVCMGGEWMCTQRMCRAIKLVKKEEKVEMEGEVEKKVVRECTRGQNKIDGCNRCICLAGNWACTLRFCP